MNDYPDGSYNCYLSPLPDCPPLLVEVAGKWIHFFDGRKPARVSKVLDDGGRLVRLVEVAEQREQATGRE